MLFCRDDFTTFILIKYSTKSNISLSITLISSQISSHSDQLIVYIVEYSGCVQKFKVGTVRARRRVDLHDQDIITGRRASLSQHELSPHAAFDKYWQKISQISWILKLVDHLSELHLKWKLTNKEQKSLSSWQQILLIFHVSVVVVFAMSTANFFCGLEMPSALLCASVQGSHGTSGEGKRGLEGWCASGERESECRFRQHAARKSTLNMCTHTL